MNRTQSTHKSADSCTSSAAWKNPSFCHCSSPPGAAMPGLRCRCRSNQAPDTGPASNCRHHPQRLRIQPPRPNPAGPGQQARSRGGPPIRSCARQEKAGDCLRASAPAGRKRKRREEGDVGGWATRRGGGGGRRGEER